jgi:hypothetical protein
MFDDCFEFIFEFLKKRQKLRIEFLLNKKLKSNLNIKKNENLIKFQIKVFINFLE